MNTQNKIIDKKSSNRSNLLLFVLFLLMSVSLHYFQELYIIKYTFKSIEVFLHESGHLITSLILGGTVHSLHLEFGSGHVIQSIGKGISIVYFMGYFSASILGFLIYLSSLNYSKYLKVFLVFYTSFFFIYADGLYTAMILFIIISIFSISWYYDKIGKYLIRFIGIYVMVSSIYSPTYLFSYDKEGDHVGLSHCTTLPAQVFIIMWVVLGLILLYKAYRFTLYKNKKESF